MKSFKKILALALVLVLALAMFTGCSKKEEEVKEIRYLNFKPEIAEVYEEIAKEYEAQTGIKVIVETAANNEYESTLMSKMATDEAPTLFQINGPRGYLNWKDYCADLTNTELYKHLTDKGLAVTVDGKAYGIPYVVEGYGIIYNNAIMDKYFALKDKGTDYKSMDEIVGFDALKAVVEDMQAHKAELGIDGVFASTSLKTGEDWRWQTHLANIPVYHEFTAGNVDLTSDATKKIEFKYGENFKNIFDLYINNSTCAPGLLGSKDVSSSMAEFALGQCAMVQNGNWAWGQISGVEGNVVKEEDCKFMPIYTGAAGEESQGLCIGTENYWSINSNASEADIKATIDFVNWMVSSAEGKAHMVNDLGNTAPFTTFTDDEKPSDPLAKSMLASMESGKTSVSWVFTVFPSQAFKDDFGSALGEYCNGSMTWDDVVNTFVTRWAEEKAATAQ